MLWLFWLFNGLLLRTPVVNVEILNELNPLRALLQGGAVPPLRVVDEEVVGEVRHVDRGFHGITSVPFGAAHNGGTTCNKVVDGGTKPNQTMDVSELTRAWTDFEGLKFWNVR